MGHTALKAASLYLLFGLVWLGCYNLIWTSLAARFPQVNPALLQYLLHAVFMACSAVLIYVLVRGDLSRNTRYSEQYRQLFYEHPVPMWIYDWDTLRFLAVNNAAVVKYGYSHEEFMQMKILDIRDPSTILQVLADVKNTKQHVAYRGIWQHRKKNGEVFSAEIYSHSTQYHGREARIVMAIDVDMEIRSTIMAKDIGTRYELLAKVTQDYIYYWDIVTNRLTSNHGPVSLFGYKDEEVNGSRSWWRTKVHPGDIAGVTASIEQAMWNGEMNWNGEYRFLCGDGTYKYVRDRGHIIYDEQKKPVRMIGAIQDIDSNTRQTRQLLHQNGVLQDIARINSHDIRKPVSAILGIVSLLDLEKNTPSLNKQLLGMLQESSAELDAMLHKIQDKLKEMNEKSSA